MTATQSTDLTAKIAALNAVLAEATEACPDCSYHGIATVGAPCDTCKGTGRIARFPEFRQECARCFGNSWICGPDKPSDGCGGRRWQVRAGGLEGGLAGLSTDGMALTLGMLAGWRRQGDKPFASEILLEGLRLVIQVGGLEK